VFPPSVHDTADYLQSTMDGPQLEGRNAKSDGAGAGSGSGTGVAGSGGRHDDFGSAKRMRMRGPGPVIGQYGGSVNVVPPSIAVHGQGATWGTTGGGGGGGGGVDSSRSSIAAGSGRSTASYSHAEADRASRSSRDGSSRQ